VSGSILAVPVAIGQCDAILKMNPAGHSRRGESEHFVVRSGRTALNKNAQLLRQALADSHALAERFDEAGFARAELEVLQDWQRQRLAKSYQALISQPRYRAAGDFFLDELYGGLNFRERDQQVERVLPVMARTMTDNMLQAMAEAFELQSLSLSLDMDMAAVLEEFGWDSLDTHRYGEVYRRCGRADDRERQIRLIGELGLKLNELVHHRLVMFLIRTLRGPARAAGFGLLQNFLENGLNAFQVMRDGTEFIETIWHSEERFMRRLFAGSKNPFRIG
jgi:hypothetical protein